jgi:hypothetical protein
MLQKGGALQGAPPIYLAEEALDEAVGFATGVYAMRV